MPITTPTKPLSVALIQEQSSGDVYDDIKFVDTFRPVYPQSTSKPQMRYVKTAQDAKEYASLLEAWEKKDAEYKKAVDDYNKKTSNIDSILEDYLKETSGLNKIPAKAREKVWSKAWSDGHSYGYGEVYSHLVGLVELFDGIK